MDYYAGKVAVITGAGSGIGRALAHDLAGRGAELALSDRDLSSVTETAHQCGRLGANVRVDAVDVTDHPAMLTHAARVQDAFGRVDLVFGVAGVIASGPLETLPYPDVEQVIRTNVLGVMNTAKAFLPQLIASGNGHLVTVASAFGLMASPYYSAYSASKFAVRGFSDSLRQEMALRGHPVAVTCVYPGGVRTPIVRNGLFAAGEDVPSIIATFDQRIARTEPERAAAVILRGVQRRRARVLVGGDARLVSGFVRATGNAYPRLLPWLIRPGRRWRSRPVRPRPAER